MKFFISTSIIAFVVGLGLLVLASCVPGSEAAVCSCGVRKGSDKIVGGTDAVKNEFPWRVALYSRSSSFMLSRNYNYFCCGTIINSKFIMTAAHCTNSIKPGYQIYVSTGNHQLSQTNPSTYKKVKKIYNHSKYNPTTQDNDFALLEMSENIFSENASAVCLPFGGTETDYANKTVVASGWGVKKQGSQEASDILQKADLTALITKDCKGYYDKGQITDNMMCTLSPGKDTCQGDSGGSVDRRDAATGQYISEGVVSWGDGCAKDGKPGVYTKVGNYLTFIKEKAGDNFCRIR